MIEDRSFGIILKKEGSNPSEFLVVKQKSHWSFPKGHSEKNESLRETVLRELREETGISRVDILENQSIVEEPYVFERSGELYQKTNEYIFGSTSEEISLIQEGEIYDAKFATLSQIGNLFIYKNQLNLLEKIKKIFNEEN